MTDLADTHFAIVVGTGLVESIVAAALARAGKSVLQIDSNDTYGSENRSFNLQQLISWMNNGNHCAKTSTAEVNPKTGFLEFSDPNSIFINKKVHWNVKDKDSEKINEDELQDVFARWAVRLSGYAAAVENKSELAVSSMTHPAASSDDVKTDVAHICDTSSVLKEQVANLNNEFAKFAQPEETNPEKTEQCEKTVQPNKFLHISRFFSIDLCPKVLLAREPLIKLLIKSDVARYCEFHLISKILTYNDSNIERVPCSRSDIFSSKRLNMKEKRLLMQFISLCLNYDEKSSVFDGFEDKPLFEYLKHRQYSALLIHYICTTFCMAYANTWTKEAISTAARLLKSAGVYGHTPFLWPIYGNGDLSQAFCRLAAVFGAVYHLRMDLHGLVYSNGTNKNIESLLYDADQSLKAQYFIVNKTYFAGKFNKAIKPRIISRRILVKSKPFFPENFSEQSLLFFNDDPTKPPVNFIEVTYESGCCSKNLFLTYAFTETDGESHYLDSAVDKVMRAATDENLSKVVPLEFSYDQVYYEVDKDFFKIPNLFITQTNLMSCFYEEAVQEAEEIFHSILPDAEFLPQAPNPDDIIFESSGEVIDEKKDSF